MEIRNGNQKALIVLHEIYGINRFIEDVCDDYVQLGYDVFCPNMLGRESFPYEEEKEAYRYFLDAADFDKAQEITAMALQLKAGYEHVFLLGFSAGATIAWQVAAKGDLTGVVCCYGSRIRDYLDLQPLCPTFLVITEETGWNVDLMAEKLRIIPNTTVTKVPQRHGFMDPYCRNYNKETAAQIKTQIHRYFQALQMRM